MSQELILTDDKEIALVQKTVAQDLLPAELDHFIHMCRHSRLDPLRRQIYAHVYKRKKKDDKGNWSVARQVVYVTGIDGYRSIADRTGRYRPGDRSVEMTEAKDPETNPQGILSATASVWKHAQGEWFEYKETVYWEEFAPLKERWVDKKPTGKFYLDCSGNWGRMGRVMLQKCAEAQALRRGWPDDYSGIYVQEELDQAKVIDVTPSEQAERSRQAERETLLGGPSIIIDWMDGNKLVSEAAAKFHGRARDFIEKNKKEPETILAFADRNKDALNQFWGIKPDEALELKKAFEAFQKEAAA